MLFSDGGMTFVPETARIMLFLKSGRHVCSRKCSRRFRVAGAG